MATTTEIERQLVESLAREAALAEGLGVLGRTPPDLQAVLDTVVERAARLCGAGMGGYLFLVAGDRFHLAAVTPDPRPEVAAYREQIRQGGPVASAFVVKRVVESKGVVYIRDASVDGETEAYRQNSKDFGYRSMLGVPLIRSGEIVGVLSLQRPDVRAFSDREVALVRAFADQAAIAVENARLFGETKEALERQTAMAEVLGAIAASPTDLQAVLDIVARNAAQFCAAEDASVLLLRDGMLSSVAHHGPLPQPTNPWPPDHTSVSGRAVAELRVVHVPDVQAEPPGMYPIAQEMGIRTFLAVPLVREGRSLGAIGLRRLELRPFTEEQIDLARTFADQAAIAIENVRLFNATKEALDQQTAVAEVLGVALMVTDDIKGILLVRRAEPRRFTQAHTRIVETFARQAAIAMENARLFNEAKEGLERQTAVAEVLRSIAGSPTDVAPVLDTIAANAARFCGAEDAVVHLIEGDALPAKAHFGVLAAVHPQPVRLERSSVAGAAILGRGTVHVPDVLAADAAQFTQARERAAPGGHRGMLAAPLMREGAPIGAIVLRKGDPSGFSPRQIELVEAFADQAVIAIENVRLFNETKEALDQQTALSEVLRTISRSAFDLNAVLQTIVDRARALVGADGAVIYRREEKTAFLLARSGKALARTFEPGTRLPIDERNRARRARTGLLS